MGVRRGGDHSVRVAHCPAGARASAAIMPFVSLRGANVHYLHHGCGGRPIVFLHGGFGSSSELWELAMAGLPQGWSGYAIDNFLRSDAPPEGYSVPALAARVADFIDALGLDRPVVAGHSMGGVVAQLVGIRYPERVSGLVLVCTGPSMTSHAMARAWCEQLAEHGSAAMREISANWFHTVPGTFFEDYVARACAAPVPAMLAVQRSLIETDLRADLGRIGCPALIVHGAHDQGRTMTHMRALLDGIRDSRLAVMPDSGHSPMVETPADFSLALGDFLSGLDERRLEACSTV
ncbi:alpha/beta hydrolase [Verticiella sediminum]